MTRFCPILPTGILDNFPYHALWLAGHRAKLQAYVLELYSSITAALDPDSSYQKLLQEASLWPRITNHALLALLSWKTVKQLPEGWRQVLTTYGIALATLQRSERLIQLNAKKDFLGLLKELQSGGREGWSALQYPDWLLMEIENDFCIRPTQARIALEMISADKNAVYQINCGEGKSSVVIPMLATGLADGNQLTRVVGLKQLLRQTQHLMSRRLGGIINRRVYYAPFSRKTELSEGTVRTLQELYNECKIQCGVQLILPEHILSLRLAGRERITSDQRLAAKLIHLEKWLEANCRDVLDECDELLDTRRSLVYSVGGQQLIDGHPDRWLLTHEVLSRVALHSTTIAERCSKGVELNFGQPGAFSSLRVTSEEAGKELAGLIVADLEAGNIAGLSLNFVPAAARQAILDFVQHSSLHSDVASLAKTALAGMPQLLKAVLLLRGLIAHGVLSSALHKRWMVEYGLDSTRCLMAVPYQAKGVPSVASEFGHPDIAILLTSLSYYYSGLTRGQLRQCFELLFKAPNAADEYASWRSLCPQLPEKLRSLESVNVDDDDMFTNQLYPQFRRNKRVADFFMSRVVFPHSAKAFLHKLSTSAWDIPASPRGKPTTGFSGTNDNRFLLPLTIEQHGLSELEHTNSMVLSLLLRPENREYSQAVDSNGKRLDIPALLRLISAQQPRINVLVDVGAQVLEMKNQDVAQAWLNEVPNSIAAVYYNEADVLMVVDREDRISRLDASPLKYKLGDCLIYLDEVHTRGVDLPIPMGVRAALTLGPRLTKDRLVQGTWESCCVSAVGVSSS